MLHGVVNRIVAQVWRLVPLGSLLTPAGAAVSVQLKTIHVPISGMPYLQYLGHAHLC